MSFVCFACVFCVSLCVVVVYGLCCGVSKVVDEFRSQSVRIQFVFSSYSLRVQSVLAMLKFVCLCFFDLFLYVCCIFMCFLYLYCVFCFPFPPWV